MELLIPGSDPPKVTGISFSLVDLDAVSFSRYIYPIYTVGGLKIIEGLRFSLSAVGEKGQTGREEGKMCSQNNILLSSAREEVAFQPLKLSGAASGNHNREGSWASRLLFVQEKRSVLS